MRRVAARYAPSAHRRSGHRREGPIRLVSQAERTDPWWATSQFPKRNVQ